MKLFNLPENIIDYFLESDCDLLAYELQKHIGGEIYCIYRSQRLNKNLPNLDDPEYYVLRYKENFINIEGIWSGEELINNWKEYQIGFSQKNAKINYGLLPCNKYVEYKTNLSEVDINSILNHIISNLD